MVYPADFEVKTGFDVLRSMINGLCLSDMGRRHCADMAMITDRTRLLAMLRRVDEMKSIFDSGSSLPLASVTDPAAELMLLKSEGSHIGAEKFAEIAKFLIITEKLRLFFNPQGDEAPRYPELCRRFRNLPDLVEPRKAIERVIDNYGQVRDNASPLLADIRRRISAVSSAMNGLLRRIMDSAVRQGVISPDASPSVRDGHLVIPVSAAAKKQIPGIVYDQSATGKTFFIEPVQVVEANNNLKELQLDERKEIIEILIALSAEIRPFINDMMEAADQVGLIDFIRAKALLARDLGAEMPSISRTPELDWYHAVHPVLLLALRKTGRKVIPLNIRLDDKQRIVVISGPNAGGKSVCLKTIAVVQYMMQCGLLPTLYSNSHMGIFAKMLIDIGDEQSIENDLSTYSSHLRNMRTFITKGGPDTLFLVDEMGSGTEPQLGGAIAQAILQKLNDNKAFGVVTTHYQNLKTFANDTPGVVNAAMLYDRQHLQPLFQLAIGTPGSSFALDIARKSGIPADVLNNAKEIAGSDYVNIDKFLLDLARDKKYWADKRLAIKEKEHKIDRLADELQAKADEIKNKRAEIIHQAKAQARNTLVEANAKIENAIREIRNAEAEKEKTKLIRRQLEEYKRQVEKDGESTLTEESSLRIPKRKKKVRNSAKNEGRLSDAAVVKQLKAGDYVRIPSSSMPGKIIAINGNKAEIALGAIRTFMRLDALTPSAPPKQQSMPAVLSVTSSEESRRRQLDFHNEIDVRGMRADEAMQAVTYFLDDALQFQAGKVRILHGTGTGALRMSIRQLLQANDAVKSFHDEDVRLGGAGITVVNLI